MKMYLVYKGQETVNRSIINGSFASDINEDILIFNRVQKAGSTTFSRILSGLSSKKGYAYKFEWWPTPGNRSRQLTSAQQVSLNHLHCREGQ